MLLPPLFDQKMQPKKVQKNFPEIPLSAKSAHYTFMTKLPPDFDYILHPIQPQPKPMLHFILFSFPLLPVESGSVKLTKLLFEFLDEQHQMVPHVSTNEKSIQLQPKKLNPCLRRLTYFESFKQNQTEGSN